MGVIRMTLLTAGALGVGMMHFGRDEGLSADRLGREPTIAQDTIVPVSGDTGMVAPAERSAGEVLSTANAVPAPKIEPAKPGLTVVPVTLASLPEPQNAADYAEAAARAMAQAAPEVEIDSAATTTLAAADDAAGEVIFVSGKRVNMRAGPSTGHGIVASLSRGTAVIHMGDAGDGWSQIKVVDTGARGFMSSKFLSPSL